MSNLRQQIESAQHEYASEHYAGDLGGVALNHLPASRKRIGKRVAWSLAIAASFLLAVIVLSDEKPPRKKMPKRTMSVATLNRPRPSLFRQSARLSDRSNRHGQRRSQSMTMARPKRNSAWVSPLAFARPRIDQSLATNSTTGVPPKRRKTLSTPSPSFSLRSLGNVISIGT